MNKQVYLSMILAAVGAGMLTVAEIEQPLRGQEKAKDKKPDGLGKDAKKLPWQIMVEASKGGTGRSNGVLLRAEFDVKQTAKGSSILIHWTLDYDGPREPLNIFRPSLEIESLGQCAAIFYLFVDKDDCDPTEVILLADEKGLDSKQVKTILAKTAFVRIKKKDVEKGTIEIPLARLEARIRAENPGKQQRFPPARMLAQFSFFPRHRGEAWNLDAWTGVVTTGLHLIPLERLETK